MAGIAQTGSEVTGNGVFANRARGFANRVRTAPGFAPLAVGCAAATVLAVATGAFETGEMPIGHRIGFWSMLMGWNGLKWQLWFVAMVREPRDWARTGAIGGVVLNLSLPLEIAVALGAWGYAPPAAPGVIWIQAMAIAATVYVLMRFIARRRFPAAAPSGPVATSTLRPAGILARAGTSAPADVLAVFAEDHYCRIRLADGRAPLVHARFGDVSRELDGVSGVQVHRGAWVAERAVAGATRIGRPWHLTLRDGAVVAVSAGHLAAVRARGWLRR